MGFVECSLLGLSLSVYSGLRFSVSRGRMKVFASAGVP